MAITLLVLSGMMNFVGAQTCSLTITSPPPSDGEYTTTTVGGQTAWQNINGDTILYFKVPSTFTFTVGVPLYLEVCYYDDGRGTVNIQYDAQTTAYQKSEVHTRSSRADSHTYVYSYHKLANPLLADRQNGGSDIRAQLSGTDGTAQAIKSMTINTAAFSDATFQLALTTPWQGAYTGPSRNDVTNDSLNYKVMCGYQGWFRCPNDLADGGWVHWTQTGASTISPSNFGIDMWPDLTGFAASEKFKADSVLTRGGATAYLFSSVTEATVLRHFNWMRKYGIDGVFLQRFLSPTQYGSLLPAQWPVAFVRKGANLEGRVWTIEYDVHGLSNTNVYSVLTADWQYLVNTCQILNNTRYLYEGTKPVVCIYGLAFTAEMGITAATADSVVNYFKSDPTYGNNYVYGGVPANWNQAGGNWTAAWSAHFDKYNAVQAWMPSTSTWTNDKNRCTAKGQAYVGHVWPGFSWAHLKNLPANDPSFKDRASGDFFWAKSYGLQNVGVTRLFVGMYDECDESTAIFPMTNDPPNPRSATQGNFIMNQSMPTDWWMLLAQRTGDTLRKHATLSSTKPTTAEMSNRSNVGPEATCDLNITNQDNNLSQYNTGDGTTVAQNLYGREHRYNATPATNRYFYFKVTDTFAYQGNVPDITIEFDYYDTTGSVQINLQYDATTSAYLTHARTFNTQGTNTWRTVRYEINNAYFGNRENGSSDFRIMDNSTTLSIYIDRVRVIKN